MDEARSRDQPFVSLPEGDDEVDMLPRESMVDPKTTSLTNLWCVWSVSFLTAIDGTVAVPSLWRYVESLGGSEVYYGLCISSFAFARLLSMGAFGGWVDARPYKEVYIVSLAVGMLAGVLYGSAPTVGLWAILAGRVVLGSMSAVSVATQAFVANHTSLADRTRYMSINTAINNSLSCCGPVFNVLIYALPQRTESLEFVGVRNRVYVFNHFTYVGYFVCVAQFLILVAVAVAFTEPPRAPRKVELAWERDAPPRPSAPLGPLGDAMTLWGLFPWPRTFLDQWLRVTGSWMVFAVNLRGNFSNFAYTYSLPLITARDYGFGQLSNSYLFGIIALARIGTTLVVAKAAKRFSDRSLMLTLVSLSGGCTLLYCAVSSMGAKKLPLARLAELARRCPK